MTSAGAERARVIPAGDARPRSGCPVCGNASVLDVVEIPRVPVHCNVLWPTRAEALAAPVADIRLGFCRGCGHTFNRAFDPALMAYSPRYENSLHFSPRFQEYAQSLAAHLIERYDLHGKDIIEIGCGKGEFLTLLCELGENRGVGFDPSYVPGEAGTASAAGFEVIQDFYSERYAAHRADLICCRHVLEHVADPQGFLRMVRRAIGGRNTVVFFEVPNGRWTLRDLAVWDIIYEHCSYFSAHSLAELFGAAGLGVRDLREAFGGQYLCLEAVSGDAVTTERPPTRELEALAREAEDFADEYQRKVAQWDELLEEMTEAGRRVVVWGAGSKGVSFLNALGIREQSEYIVDLNPRKHGMHVAGTGQRIVPPEFLRTCRPDAIVVMNAIYEDEIRARIENLGISCELLCA